VSDEERLFELLERWEELRRQGREISPQELCARSPDLQPELEQAIRKLEQADLHLDLRTPDRARSRDAGQDSANRSSPWPWLSKASSTPAEQRTIQQSDSPADEEVPATWKPGDVILGLYEVREVFTGGGRGLVYRIRHRGWGIDLAVKSPRPEYFLTEKDKEDFEEEAKTWVNLSLHPHTVTCYYVRRLGGIPRVFAEYVAGGSLARWIQVGKLYQGGREKALARILDIAIQVAWGLQQAHEQGLIHRDVKPGNILLTPEGVAKVTDFGMARARGSPAQAVANDTLTSILVSAGGMTPAFCSPEQAAGQPVSRKTDIWSWAVSVLSMFTGGVAWSAGNLAPGALKDYLKTRKRYAKKGTVPLSSKGQSPFSRPLFRAGHEPNLPAMPSAVAELLLHCFESPPENRPKDMIEIAAVLEKAYERATGMPYPRKPPGTSKALADSLNNRAISLRDLNRFQEAEALWEEALTIGPHHPEATYNLGLSRWRDGRTTGEALVQSLHEVCVSHPGEWLPLYLLAQVYLERGKPREAFETLQKISSISDAPLDVERGAQSVERAGNGRLALRAPRSAPIPAASLDEVRSALAAAQKRSTNADCLLHSFSGHSDWVSSVTLTFDGRYAVSGSADRSLKYWDLSTGQCLRTLEGHTEWVTTVCLSADGQRALSGSADKTLKLWDLASGQCLQTFSGHANWVLAACLSEDNQYALSAGGDCRLRLWDLATGSCLRDFGEHGGPVLCLAWSSDRRYALSGGRDKILHLWDVTSGQCLRTFLGHQEKIHAVALSRDQRYALSGSADRTLKLWEVESGRCLRTLQGHTDGVLAVALSGDGRYALSGSGDRTLKLWRLTDGCCLCSLEGHTGAIYALDLTADGRVALSGSGDRTLRLWRLHGEWVAPYLVSQVLPSETALAAWTDFERALSQAQEAAAEGDSVRAAQWIREARSLPGHGGRPEAMTLWSSLYVSLPRSALQGGWEAKSFALHLDAVTTVCLSNDGSFALSGSADRTLRVWDVATGQCLRTLVGHSAEITSACFSADGLYILSGSADRTLKLWTISTGQCLNSYQAHDDVVTSVSLSAGGHYALSGSLDRTLRLWDLRTGQCLRTLEGHSDPIHSVSLSADGRYALSGAAQFLIRTENRGGAGLREKRGQSPFTKSADRGSDPFPHATPLAHAAESERLFTSGQLKLWDLDADRCLPTFEGHADAVTAVALDFTGRYALSGGGFSIPQHTTGRLVQSGPIHLWEVATGRCLSRFAGHAGAVTSVCLSLDARYALSGGTDRTIKLWETASGQCLRTFAGHLDAVTAVALSADGRFALSGSADRTLKLWVLDWELEDKQPADWDEGARPYLETFLRIQTPRIIALPEDRRRTVKEIMHLPLSRLFMSAPAEKEGLETLRRRGKPRWSENDWQRLLHLLGCAGYGWLRPEVVRSRLKRIARRWLDWGD
jgi:WD40 repeat protein